MTDLVGYYHPIRGYWEATQRPKQSVIDSYPAGTREVPTSPGIDYEFNPGADNWVKKSNEDIRARKAAELRSYRDFLLRSVVDNISPARWEGMTDSQKRELRYYRQTLLDIPQQSTFPDRVVVPETPGFLKGGVPNVVEEIRNAARRV